jgi:hypothetical protein
VTEAIAAGTCAPLGTISEVCAGLNNGNSAGNVTEVGRCWFTPGRIGRFRYIAYRAER